MVAGTVLVFATLAVTPGLALIDPADADDFIGIGRAVGENTALSFFVTMFGVLGLVLQLYGVLVLRRVARGEGASDAIARFGAMSFGVGIGISIIDRAVLYTAAHTLKYGIGAGVGPDQSQLLDFISVILVKMQSGLNLMGFCAFLLGSLGLGAGLMVRLRSTPQRIVAALMLLSCLVSLVFVAAISPFYGLAGAFRPLFTVAVMLTSAWLVMLGVGIAKGMPEFSETEGAV